jgi:hypothetical protein
LTYRKIGHNLIDIDQVRGYIKRYNEHGDLTYKRNSRLAWIMKRYVTNGLGMEDSVYYYLTYKLEWKKGWATEKFANIPKYDGTTGTIINYEVIDKALEGMRIRQPGLPYPSRVHRSSLVVAMSPNNNNNNESPTEFWYASMKEALDFNAKYNSKFISPWRADSVGLPKDIFHSSDIFDSPQSTNVSLV